MARILAPTAQSLELAGARLRAGQVVGMPTETVYGLAGAAFDETALARIFAVKERPTFDPLIVHVSPSMAGLERLAELELVALATLSQEARNRAQALMTAFWPGPLTLVLPKHARVPDLATSGLATVGLRLPRHPVAQRLIEAAGTPLAAPSANRFGRISPTTAAAVEAELGDRIELIVDGGACEVGLESTVVSIAGDGTLTLLRPGAISREELVRVTGVEPRVAAKPYEQTAGLSAPGMLESHYAPRTPLHLLPCPVSRLTREQTQALPRYRHAVGLLAMSGPAAENAREFGKLTGFDVTIECLSRTGSLEEIARNLFHGLRRLDGAGVSVIFAEPSPSSEGLGHAIADRLGRAAHR
jgi:L-threonylcarbamoyladenylate synthase